MPPVTMPLVPTDAVAGLLLLQVPPAVASLSDVVSPGHTLRFPRIAPGNGLTVTVVVIEHVVGNVNVIIEVLGTNTDIPVTTPDDEPTIAIPVALLVHVPLPDASDKDVVKPEHTLFIPSMAVGNGFTVTTVVMIQPVALNA